MKKSIIFFIIIFQIIVNIKCQQYTPIARSLHTAVLIEKKIYFLGGLGDNRYFKDFFFLDLSKSIDVTKKIPFINLSGKASILPPHYAAAATPYGNDSIFLFGGYTAGKNPSLAYSFNSSQLEWNALTISQGSELPERKAVMNAVANNTLIYIFGGGFPIPNGFRYGNTTNIYNTIDKSWTISDSGLPGRDGHTATFLPKTGEIIYIGGFIVGNLTSLDVYNTLTNSWWIARTKNSLDSRYGHSAVLTNDGRIIVFGGSKPTNAFVPVTNRYVVLDTKTYEWYLGTDDVSTKAPFRHHTATLYNDYMFIAFGILNSNQPSSNFLIYKIGDYANFSLVNNYIPDPISSSTSDSDSSTSDSSTSSTPSTEPANSNNSQVAIRASLGSLLGIVVIGFIGFVAFKWYNRTKIYKFEHVLNT